ncbi:glycine zipper 2TM domain-containing protein [Thermomonas sp. HDW16]|uniref:glycine zipper 2TM domain-containing protein n=1 Tax=Thermomonas sp. HDW16 TaxID=2714945 RepID=UPI00140A4C46|nr:glycine zipper 2TM domain-containing protein [Thermomonas sp. HDW16]QIL20477.1 glycine zipper 2TM domain-containing protein [Thermomonas sp. HDW16]
MKNNTLAIALAALLVGGVATAGYINNRDNARNTNAPSDVAGAHFADANGEPLPMDGAIPASGRLDYADVVGVEPVVEREKLYATVIGTDPVRESSTTSTPQQVCEDVVVAERMPERDGNVGGTVAGAVIGGLVGNQVGGGNGRKLATVGGAVAGGYIGNRVDRRHVGGQVVNRTDRRCRTVNNTSTSSRTVAWNVTYRNPDGTTGSMRTESKPGSRIALGEGSKTVGYDVTYRLDGENHTVRMDQQPGARLPVIDGQVVTQVASAAGNPNG